MLGKLLIPHDNQGLFFLICLLSVIVGCGAFDQTEDNVGLIVGSSHITTEKLKRDMEFISAGMEVPAQEKKQFADQLLEQCINRYLILEYGKEQGIAVSQNELNNELKEIKREYTDEEFNEALLRGYVTLESWKNRLREQLLVNKIMKKVFDGIIPPTYQEIKQYFETNQDEFRSPKMVEFRQIVTRTKEEAVDLHKRLTRGEQMSELAKKHSIAPEAEKGGKVGWVAEGDLNESMEKVLFSMDQGKFSSVVETPYGYHIFEVLSVRPAGVKKLSNAIEEIRSKLILQKREIFLKNWLQDLRNHFEVKVNHSLLSRMEFS